MTVIIAHDTPDAIRGLLKRWFIEPRPNVFVGTINRRTREKTLDYICHRAVENRPLAGTSKPATPRFFIHITGFLTQARGFSILQ
ncbi:MAG: type I-E CRISPR-associated endoribonuclease Cas2e, partial [Verrucomicrobiota bacterium]